MTYTDQARELLPKKKGHIGDDYAKAYESGFNQAIEECVPVVAKLLEERDKLKAYYREKIKRVGIEEIMKSYGLAGDSYRGKIANAILKEIDKEMGNEGI